MSFDPPEDQAIRAVRDALGARMVELRKATNLSQSEASARAGINVRSWGRIEKAMLNPRLDSLLRIQVAFELDSLDALFAPTTGDLLLRRAGST